MSRKLVVEIVGDSRQLERTLGKTESRLTKFNRNVESSLSGATLGGKGGASGLLKGGGLALGAGVATKKIIDLTNAASDMQEQVSKTNVVFGDFSAEVIRFGDTSAKSFGLAKTEAIELAGTFGALFRPLGFTSQAAAKQSVALVKLGADLASFYNTDVASALEAIKSGIVGESEPLRRYGVLLSEVRVQQEALSETGKKSVKQLTGQEKALARIQIIFKDSAVAQGDFARTSSHLAQQEKILSAQSKDLEVKLGTLLLPAVTGIVTEMNKGTSAAMKFGDALERIGGIKLPSIAGGNVGGFVGKAAGFLGGSVVKGVTSQAPFLEPLGKLIAGLAGGKGGVAGTGGNLLASRSGPFAFNFGQSTAAAAAGGAFGATNQKTALFKFGGAKVPGAATGLSVALQQREADARLGGNRAALKGVLVAESQFLHNALGDLRLNPQQKVSLTEALVGIKGEIDAIDQQVIDDAKEQADKIKEQRKKIADAAKAAQKKREAAFRKAAAALKKAEREFKSEADDIKNAVLKLFDFRETKIDNLRALADAKKALRLANRIGGPEGILHARRDLQDAQLAIARQRLEATAFTVTGGPKGPVNALQVAGNITINVNGSADPEQTAKAVIAVLNRARKHGVHQFSGTAPNHNSMT